MKLCAMLVTNNADYKLLQLGITSPVSVLFKKYKTFSVLIYSYINTSGNWKNKKLCGNTTACLIKL